MAAKQHFYQLHIYIQLQYTPIYIKHLLLLYVRNLSMLVTGHRTRQVKLGGVGCGSSAEVEAGPGRLSTMHIFSSTKAPIYISDSKK
jgi:hypothetical protein